jgi:uncharacterized protein YkuJ
MDWMGNPWLTGLLSLVQKGSQVKNKTNTAPTGKKISSIFFVNKTQLFEYEILCENNFYIDYFDLNAFCSFFCPLIFNVDIL